MPLDQNPCRQSFLISFSFRLDEPRRSQLRGSEEEEDEKDAPWEGLISLKLKSPFLFGIAGVAGVGTFTSGVLRSPITWSDPRALDLGEAGTADCCHEPKISLSAP